MCALYNLPVYPEINENRQDQIYHVFGAEFAFFGLDYAQKLHGRKQDYYWLNEIMEVDLASFDQLEMRTSIMGIIDYNPSDDEHWVFNLALRPDVKFLYSTMLDNPFLPEPIRLKILSYEPNEENIRNGTADSYMWEVYGLGHPAKLEGLIFDNWKVVDSIPEGAKDLGLGLDFGFSNDPLALIEVYEYDKTVYLNELIYATHMLNSDLISRMQLLGIDESRPITADSSEPKSIVEVRNAGFNISGAVKGADSVRYGIDLMKGLNICITRSSINLDKERRRYKWATKANGELIKKNGKSVPVDEFNHCIDGARYRITKMLGNKHEVQVIDGGLFS